jgi:CBS domain containing-hemolysin-like protein
LGGLNLGLALIACAPILIAHWIAVAIAKALRTYSRRRLEEVCDELGVSSRADLIAHQDDRTERSAEIVAVLTGLLLVAIIVVALAPVVLNSDLEIKTALAIVIAGLGHLAALIVGRVYAERLLAKYWPVASAIRAVSTPVTFLARNLEALLIRFGRGPSAIGRPASVEVEIHSADEEAVDLDADLPESTRELLERSVELARRDVSEVMTPLSSVVSLPESVSVAEAARVFRESGRSRIPLFGEHRDDIVGVLYLKDLFAMTTSVADVSKIQPRKLARTPFFVPETKNANDLLEEFRSKRMHIAVVLDEYGAVAGLITLEDLIEEIVGPIDDEHDVPTPEDPLIPTGPCRFEVDAALPIEELNDRLGLDLPTDEDYQTVGGLAFQEIGRVPEPGESFRKDGVEFIIREVEEHSIRKLEINLEPEKAEIGHESKS